jgi:phospholipase/carboxylesterase
VTPRAPLSLPPGGAHWYALRRVGFPDPETFAGTWPLLTDWLDALPQETGVGLDRTVIGGFSQGTVMTYAVSLAAGRPRPAAVIALSGFIPTVDGLELDLASAPPVAIGHGAYDEVIGVEFSRDARRRLQEAGVEPLYREYPYPHAVDPRFLTELRPWIEAALSGA